MKFKPLPYINIRYFAILLLMLLVREGVGQQVQPFLNDTVRFRVDMSYMLQNGTFDPSSDSVDITGTMNSWGGTIMRRITGTGLWEVTFLLPIASVQSYRFRICSSDTVTENPDPMSRFVMIGDSLMTVTNYYDNFNPAVVPMTFRCNLYYQISASHFSPAVDYLDVSGNFNNWGGNTVLFPESKDSIYALTMFFDTAMIGQTLKFKFGFNGDTVTTELPGDTNRSYTLVPDSNSFTCWYNNIDPSVPSIPFVYNVAVNDTAYILKTLTGTYNYEDYNLRPEGQSIYQWYYADSLGGALSKIDTGTTVNFKVDSLHYGKYLVFEVTPVTADTVIGLTVRAWSITPIIWIGVPGKESPVARLFPNPVSDILTVEFLKPVKKVEIFDSGGRLISSEDKIAEMKSLRISTSSFKPGTYYLRVTGPGNSTGGYRFIRQ